MFSSEPTAATKNVSNVAQLILALQKLPPGARLEIGLDKAPFDVMLLVNENDSDDRYVTLMESEGL